METQHEGQVSGAVLIVGASGMFGKELYRYLALNGVDVIGVRRSELDVRDELSIYRVLKRMRLYSVVNCSGYTDVMKAEEKDSWHDVMAVNWKGAEYLAGASNKYGVRFIQVSCGDVFCGDKSGLYNDDEERKPGTTYGISKLLAEDGVIAKNKRAIILRFPWLIGNSQGSMLHELFKGIASKDSVTVAQDVSWSPMTTLFASRVVGSVLAMSHIEGVYNVSHDNFCNMYELTLLALLEKGYTKKCVLPVDSDRLVSTINRPKEVRMSNKKLCDVLGLNSLGTWQEDVCHFMKVYGSVL